MQKYIKPEFYITEFETDDTGKTNSCQYVDAIRRSANRGDCADSCR